MPSTLPRFLKAEHIIECDSVRDKVYVPYLENYLDGKHPEAWLREREAYEQKMMRMLDHGFAKFGARA
jgi:hypothetical protein